MISAVLLPEEIICYQGPKYWSLGHKASYGYILLVLEATMQISIDLQAILSY